MITLFWCKNCGIIRGSVDPLKPKYCASCASSGVPGTSRLGPMTVLDVVASARTDDYSEAGGTITGYETIVDIEIVEVEK